MTRPTEVEYGKESKMDLPEVTKKGKRHKDQLYLEEAKESHEFTEPEISKVSRKQQKCSSENKWLKKSTLETSIDKGEERSNKLTIPKLRKGQKVRWTICLIQTIPK